MHCMLESSLNQCKSKLKVRLIIPEACLGAQGSVGTEAKMLHFSVIGADFQVTHHETPPDGPNLELEYFF